MDYNNEIPKYHKKRGLPNKFWIEYRYVGEFRFWFRNKDWSNYSGYRTLKQAKQALESIHKKQRHIGYKLSDGTYFNHWKLHEYRIKKGG